MEVLVFCGLILLIIAQWVYFSFIVHGLVNKLMSRNYVDYQQGNSLNKDVRENVPTVAPLDPSVEFEDLRVIGG